MHRIPEIIAHRGVPREAPENTLPGFSLALTQGADAIELDVHGTADGVVVVHHDPSVLVRTATGTQRVQIDALPAEELLALPLDRGGHVPTLEAVLELIGPRAGVYVEVKAAGIEAALLTCLARHPKVRVAVHAFDHRIPAAIQARRPGMPIGYLSGSYPVDLAGSLGPPLPASLWQHVSLLDEPLVAAAHALGVRVVAWTVNDPAAARWLAGIGVDALCTDVPGTIRAALTDTAVGG